MDLETTTKDLHSVIKRDGRIVLFDGKKIYNAILKAAGAVADREDKPVNEQEAVEVRNYVVGLLSKRKIAGEFPRSHTNFPNVEDIQDAVEQALKETGHNKTSQAYHNYREDRTRRRESLAVIKSKAIDTTDRSLLLSELEVETPDDLDIFQSKKIARALMLEAGIKESLAYSISKDTTDRILDYASHRKPSKDGKIRLRPARIREFVNDVLEDLGLEERLKQQDTAHVPYSDIEALIFGKSNENSNITANNGEAVNLAIAENSLKEYSLDKIFSQDVADAHRTGMIHLHDLGYPTRVYCSSHSLEFIKKFALKKDLPNLSAKSTSAKEARTLTGHLNTFLASKQADYAGALGVGYVNIHYAPALFKFEKIEQNGGAIYKRRELSDDEMMQEAQHLVFSCSQSAFSRGGQTLFIDFNVHTGVPEHMKNVPAIGPKGKYYRILGDGLIELIDGDVPRDKEDNLIQDKEKPYETYGTEILEKQAQRFLYFLLETWRRGDGDGAPFPFPKCDLHVDENSFTDPEENKLLRQAAKGASENGFPYFVFDRGKEVTLSQCCRLRETVTDKYMIQHPESMRFTGFQNVTINLPQAAYRAKGNNLEERVSSFLKNIDEAMDLAVKAHLQKRELTEKMFSTKGSALYHAGQKSSDGRPYIDLNNATYIVGMIGLNEAVQSLTEKQLHESEEAFRLGLYVAAHMYNKAQAEKERHNLKISLEESPAESAMRRFAKIDLRKYKEQTKKVLRGTEKDPYYTNSIHFAPEAEVSMIERIIKQSKFHPVIESGAIIHAFVGEYRPAAEAIYSLVEKTYRNIPCAQLTISPEFTICREDKVLTPRLVDACPKCGNTNPETLKQMTRIVGYFSEVPNWHGSKVKELRDREKAARNYADMSVV